jgi:hypothetical protein
MRKSAVVVGLSGLLILLAGSALYSYFTPQLALKSIKDAAKAQDTERLHDLIDFEAVRAGLKEDLRTVFRASAGEELRDNPFAGLGLALVGVMIDPLVDALVSPSSLSYAMSEGRIYACPSEDDKRSRSGGVSAGQHKAGKSESTDNASREKVNIEGAYAGYSRYRITIRSVDEKPEAAVGFTLRREGLFSWKLSRIILPKFFFAESTGHRSKPSAETRLPTGSVESLIGERPPHIFSTSYGQRIAKLLGPDYGKFQSFFDASTQIFAEGSFVVGTGCLREELCDIYSAAFAVEKISGNIYAVMHDGRRGSRFWGVSSPIQLPGPLRAWARERNMEF